jgi:glycosyltransferase involved in cell wall biosynthesis
MICPSVSILMPVRNEERFLPAAIASLRAQTFTDWELVAVDDHSTDRTSAILATAAATDGRVRVLCPPLQGLVPALNAGLALCRAPLVARMDGDDVCHPERLARQTAFMAAHPSIGLVASNFRHFPRRHLKVGMLAYEEWQNSLLRHDDIMRDRFVESPFVHPTVMIRRELLLQVNGYRDLGWAEDYDLWLRLADNGARFASLPEVLLYWRDRPERSTRTMGEYAAEAFRRCKAHHLQRGFLRGATAVALIGAGQEGRAWRKVLGDAGIGVKSWIDLDPRKVGRDLHGTPVLAADTVMPGNGPMLVTIGTRGARALVRQWAAERGLTEGADYVCVT